MSSRQRVANVVLEPPAAYAVTAEEARRHMTQLRQVVSDARFEEVCSVTVHCYRNDIMTREYVDEIYQLVTVDRGVPKLRVIDPTPDAAAYLFDAAKAAGKPDSIEVRISDSIGRTSHTKFPTLTDYLAAVA